MLRNTCVGDDLPDVYLVSQDGPNKLFKQVEPFRFEDVTAAAGGLDGGEAWGAGASFVDIDDDGDLDLYVCNTEAPNLLYLNRGDGTFVEAAADFGLVKQKEAEGFQYEGAEGSFRLLVERALPGYKPPFELVDFMVVMEKRRRPGSDPAASEDLSEAMVKVAVDGDVKHTVAEGNGPVNALDAALRKGLEEFYPHIASVELTDFKVRVVDTGPSGTGAVVRVLIESSDGERHWGTVGVSTNVIEASWQALADSMEYALLSR